MKWKKLSWRSAYQDTTPSLLYTCSTCTHVDSARWQLPQVASSKWTIFSFVFVIVSCFLSLWSEELQNYRKCKKVHFPAAKCSEDILGCIFISKYFNINFLNIYDTVLVKKLLNECYVFFTFKINITTFIYMTRLHKN